MTIQSLLLKAAMRVALVQARKRLLAVNGQRLFDLSIKAAAKPERQPRITREQPSKP